MSKKIPKYDFNSNRNLDFEITSIRAIYQKSSSKLMLPHRQDFFGIFHFSNSVGKHIVDFESYNINKNDVFLISNEQVHYFEDIENTEGNVILFTHSFLENDILMEQIFDQYINRPICAPNIQLIKNVEILLSQMNEVFNSNKKRKVEILKKYLEILLLEIYGTNQENSLFTDINYQRFIVFRRDLRENYKTQKKVSFYAEKQHISNKTLNLAVREIIDTSAKQFISSHIMLLAKRMLVNTIRTSTEISYELGFDEPTNFTKYFIRQQSVSPLMFRKRYKM